MPKADTSVKWFHSGMTNAPVLRGQTGALIELLDACLLNGFDVRYVNSIVVASGVATVTISAGHSYEVPAVISIAGVTGELAALNDEWRITTAGASTLSFACPGVADGTAAGTITAMRASAGWAKPFSASGKGVYQSQVATSTQLFLRVDDTDARYSRVRGYENMSDVDTGAGLFPTLAQRVETAFTWAKSTVADTSARAWLLVADGAFIHFLPKHVPTNPHTLHAFGDLVSYLSADAYHCICVAHVIAAPANSGASHDGVSLTASTSTYCARQSTQSGAASAFIRSASIPSGFMGVGMQPYPGIDGKLQLAAPVLALDSTGVTSAIRGEIPGLLAPAHSVPLNHLSVVDGAGAFAGRKILMSSATYSTAVEARVAFDITGPWR